MMILSLQTAKAQPKGLSWRCPRWLVALPHPCAASTRAHARPPILSGI